jgi:hypothetical protein
MRQQSVVVLLVSVALMSACSDSSGPAVGTLAIRSGDGQSALAGTPLPTPVVVNDPTGQATFSVIAGGGTISSSTGQVNSDGTVTAPTWTLGKSAVAQKLQVTAGSETVVINATVRTSFKTDVRFFGRALTQAQQDLFTNAAVRIRAFVVGQLALVNGNGADPAKYCGATGVAPLTGTIDGMIIYASIDSIDGRGKILAQSGPCYTRTTDFTTVIGVMKFDSADVTALANSGNLQEVITHEMIHVLGFGTDAWDSTHVIINKGTPTVAYTGAGGIAGCQSLGAAVTCATSVPVENTGGVGTADSHWRESVFKNELMTGYLNSGTNPLSVMTIRSIGDLGYTINAAAADPYTLPAGTAIRASFQAAPPTSGEWERPLPHAPRTLPTLGLSQIIRSK